MDITVAILAQGTILALASQQAFSATLTWAVVLQQVEWRDNSMLRHVLTTPFPVMVACLTLFCFVIISTSYPFAYTQPRGLK